ncbi:hypothetical protein ACLKA6_013611 [Drosophila palustris]
MAESYPNWMPSLNLVVGNAGDGDDEQGSELFMPNRPFGPRLSFFQSELHNLSQLSKLYQNIPVYGNGPLTDDEKREIARRNNGFVADPTDDNNNNINNNNNNNINNNNNQRENANE